MKETDAYKKHKLKREEKLKSVKSGKNVFHLYYFSGMISPTDLTEYENSITDIGCEFSSFDKSGEIYNSLTTFTLDVCFIISQITVQSIIINSINSGTWDAIKFVLLKIWKKAKNQEITEYSSRDSKKKKLKFGMKVSIDKNTHLDFHLDGDLSEELVLESLDKTFDFIKSQKKNSEFKHAYFVKYDKKKGKWKSIDTEKEMRKIAAKKRKNR